MCSDKSVIPLSASQSKQIAIALHFLPYVLDHLEFHAFVR